MKLLYSPASPFARKALVVAHEVGVIDRVEIVAAKAHPVDRDATLRAQNPLGQIPTLLLDDGTALYDSRVICEYIDALGGGGTFPAGAARWTALTDQALADGLLGAALLLRYEDTARPAALRWEGWTAGQGGKIADALARFDTIVAAGPERVDIGTITIGCALGYLDLRFASLDWRRDHPATAEWFARFSERPSMAKTVPAG